MKFNEAHHFLYAIEEMYIRLFDGSEMTKQAVSKLREETQEKIADFRNTNRPYGLIHVAGYVMYDLSRIEDLTVRQEVAVSLMGYYASDLFFTKAED